MRLSIALVIVIAAGCAGPSSVGNLRFKNQPVVWKVNDRENVAVKPKERKYFRALYHVDGFVVRRMTRAMEVRKKRRAQNVNALDEAPDSTWWTNRIGVRDLTVAEVSRGPNIEESPELHKPWTITSSKPGGTAVGFVMKDARGYRYLLKFDDRRGPEMETAADLIVQRLLWACGFNVPEDDVVNFRREDLILADDATIKDAFGKKEKLTLESVEESLGKVGRLQDGSFRGLVSRYLPGIPIGPWSREGRRSDDPNDRIAHEDRRELRGARTIFAWLNHTDLQEDNTLDMWHEDKATGTRYVMHYFIDFGKALGVMGALNRWKWPGHEYRFDLSVMTRALLTAGLWQRPKEKVRDPKLKGVGLLGAREFDPGAWRPNSIYFPFEDRDRFDAFWGAKIIIRLSRAHIRAAVETGKLSNPASVDYLVDTLVERQRKSARYWFQRVAPLDRFAVSGDRICFEDLSVRYKLGNTKRTTYQLEGFDKGGEETGWRKVTRPSPSNVRVVYKDVEPFVATTVETAAPVEGTVCVDGLQPSSSQDGYTIVRIVTKRGATELPATLVHLARGSSDGQLRVIGLVRR